MTGLGRESLFWKFSTSLRFNGSPVVHHGLVFVGTLDGQLYGLDAASGEERLRFSTDEMFTFLPEVAGDRIYIGCRSLRALDIPTGEIIWVTSPNIWTWSELSLSEREIFVTGALTSSLGDEALFAISAENGKLIWQCPLDSESQGKPEIAGDIAYVTLQNPGELIAVDSATGGVRWKVGLDDQASSGACCHGELVYSGTASGTLYALDCVTGEERWRLNVGNGSVWPCSISKGLLYVKNMDWNVRGGFVSALDAETGRQRWRVATGDSATFSPLIVDDVVYIGSTADNFRRNLIHALDAQTGVELWNMRVPANAGISATPAFINNRFFVPSHDGAIYAIDAPNNKF